MGLFLNSIAPYDKYKMISQDPYFVDKSAVIEELRTLDENSVSSVLSGRGVLERLWRRI